jgi:hypothetical protein
MDDTVINADAGFPRACPTVSRPGRGYKRVAVIVGKGKP